VPRLEVVRRSYRGLGHDKAYPTTPLLRRQRGWRLCRGVGRAHAEGSDGEGFQFWRHVWVAGSCGFYYRFAMLPPAVDIPTAWSRGGLVIPRPVEKNGYGVMGDPCIVWDEEISTWRMVLFCDPPGHGQSICLHETDGVPDRWSPVEPLRFVEPLYSGGPPLRTHKPYIVQEAGRPNHPARIHGEYWLVSVMNGTERKFIQRARATSLAGPWTWDEAPLIPTGGPGEFDEKHADAVSGFYFPERDEVLYFYMGYPAEAQPRGISPWGNAQGIAVQKADAATATKLGMVLPPVQEAGHWASGYFGGLQLLPGKKHRWVALLNASPTAPTPEDTSVAREEPAPSLGGWAWCDEEWPVKNWHVEPQPMEWIEDIPAEAIAEGEGTNLWRHHALVLADGRVAVYYNSGFYGKEQVYLKVSGEGKAGRSIKY